MPGIIPDSGTHSVNWNAPNVEGVTPIPDDFSISCTYRVLPSDCNYRILPEQINALVSEMINLAACFDPEGTWHCGQLDNLCNTFTTFKDYSVDFLEDLDSRVLAIENNGPGKMRYVFSPACVGAQNIPQSTLTTITDWASVSISSAGGVSYSAGVFTVLQGGMWSVNAYVVVGSDTASQRLSIYVNGTVRASAVSRSDDVDAGNNGEVTLVMPLAINDQVTIRFFGDSSSGGSYQITNGRMTMCKIGDL